MANTKYIFGVIIISLVILGGCKSDKSPRQRDISANWQFKASAAENWLTAKVPGVVHTDLMAHQLIPDPFIGTNEDSVQWVEEMKWAYKTSFTLTDEEHDFNKIDLVFAGLDTYAEVFLNGKPILDADNMFRKWRVEVKGAIKPGDNELRVVFTPPVEKNKQRIKELGYKLPAGSETGEWQASPFTRKAAYQFGWDFAPRLVTMGIWRSVHLEFWDQVRIENVRFELKNLSTVAANYTVYLDAYANYDNTKYTLQVLESVEEINLNRGLNNVAIDITIADPKLWWPNGLGEPHLYDIPIEILSGNLIAASLNKRLGIRTIELVQDIDTIGKSFYFKVNGKKVFVKGANWSPLSSFPGLVNDSTYINRLRAVKDAHMNMLRVWGGGIYERDLFYDLCDENGIMVWQDFMFANSMYPGDKAFFENVKEEVNQQVNRLQTHPSLAFWNGNNEIEVAWKNWGWQKQYGYSAKDSVSIWMDYEHLFKQLIPEIIKRNDPTRAYTSTSPLSNWGHPDNFNSGSMHYWGVWHGGDSFEDYKANVGRFMAEYGFQSYPDLKTVEYYASTDKFDIDSPSSHQKSYVGNNMIIREIDGNFGNVLSIKSFHLKSQETQALALKKAIEAHRINMQHCGGTLFWQLNDCWPGPSWSVIDYFGNKKIAYEVVKDRYKPVVLIADTYNNNFSIVVVSDLPTTNDAILRLELIKHENNQLWVTEQPVKVPLNAAENVYRSDIRKLLDGMAKEEVYLKITLLINDEIIDIEKFYFVKPKDYPGQVDLVGDS